MTIRPLAAMFAATATLILANGAAHGSIINPTNPAVFAFDAPGAVPSPSIIELTLSFGTGTNEKEFGVGDLLSFSIYDELDESALFSFGPYDPLQTVTGLSDAFALPFSDGAGFVFVEANAGSFELASLVVRLGTGSIDVPEYGPAVAAELISSVPEPSGLTLVGAGLVGMWLARRRPMKVLKRRH